METVIEQSEKVLEGGRIIQVQTVRRDDGTEFQRELYYTCSICGATSDRPFARSAISCMRSECRDS